VYWIVVCCTFTCWRRMPPRMRRLSRKKKKTENQNGTSVRECWSIPLTCCFRSDEISLQTWKSKTTNSAYLKKISQTNWIQFC
jgi:hypothetical protein